MGPFSGFMLHSFVQFLLTLPGQRVTKMKEVMKGSLYDGMSSSVTGDNICQGKKMSRREGAYLHSGLL